MKTLYFDCSSGISGNMVLGALTEIISVPAPATSVFEDGLKKHRIHIKKF